MDRSIELRPAQEDDAADIARLVRGAKLNPTGLDWKRFTVAEDSDGNVVGCGQVKPHRDGSLELASLVVDPRLRGQGVGRRLIESLLEGVSQPLWLMCRSSLVPLYERFGFEEVGPDDKQPRYFRRVRRLASVYHFLRGTGEYLAVMFRGPVVPPGSKPEGAEGP